MEISNNLSVKSHIQNVTTSASRSLGFLKRNIWSKNTELRNGIQNSCSPICGVFIISLEPYTKSNIARLEMVQCRAARWTLSEYFSYASVTQMLQSLGWRSLEQRRSDSRLCLFYKIIYGLVAIDMPSYIVHQLRILRNSHTLGFRQIQTVIYIR